MGEWSQIFNNNIQVYMNIINNHLETLGFFKTKVENCLDKLSFNLPAGIQTKHYLKEGKYPIVSQSKEFVIGYTNQSQELIDQNLPLIIFGDHTKEIKYIDFPFHIGADGVKLLRPIDAFIPRFFYYSLLGVSLGTKNYGRHFKLLRESEIISIDDKKIQKNIISFLDDLKTNKLKSSNYFDAKIEKQIVMLQYNSIDILSISSQLKQQELYLKKIRQAILQEAIEGKLTAEWRASTALSHRKSGKEIKGDPDFDAAALLEKVKVEKAKLISEGKLKKEKALPTVEDSEKPFELPEGWVWCRLGEIIEYTENLDIQKYLSPDTIINYVDIDSIDNKKYIIRESKSKTVSELSTRARRVLKKGYLVYSTVRPYLRNIAFIEDEKDNYIGSTGFNVFKTNMISNKYVFYLLLGEYINDLFLEYMNGFNSPSITNEQFEKTAIPLPPLSEQQAIVDRVDSLLSMVDVLEKQVNERKVLAEELMQSVLREAFG